MPIGQVTRGTTGTNRLRRVDRWIAALPAFRRAADPLVVDLGYGASATTPLELHQRLAKVRPDVEVVGIEIEPERVRVAQLEARPGVSFRLGGFEVPLSPTDEARGRHPAIIRAFNVLRQYDEDQVAHAWDLMTSRLATDGILIEGTCNEVGRVASWVDVTSEGPQTFTASLHLGSLESPTIIAERLPKALIHRNVEGERVHSFLQDLDRQWAYNAGLAVYSPVQRWVGTVEGMRAAGWPVLNGRSRWRLGEVTVPWSAVAPL
ncbi:methylase [Frondihabitans sp. PAMC 28766]|uniref:methylase n=1 Tax=Frondihabitans sp. PAMC 28766 TaxID=1795630 RepID=UPI00078B8840|nr:methylase [Frondihabitans sp. PAMC 28766]AMM19916.1 methylase [Frondihabitans sp. PAMC 28766]